MSPGVTFTAADGRRISIPSRVAAGLGPAPVLGAPFKDLFIFDSGWGGLNMVIELAKQQTATLVHIKNSFAGYPMAELDQHLRGMPGGSFLEMRATVDGIRVIALAAKYNSHKTCFFCAPEGAAPTTPGQPYITKFTDENRNGMTREVPRPALAARYFGTFNKVDVHDQRRQHELGLEEKWVVKGEDSGKFRFATTVFGMTVVDVMLALTCHSHPGHAFRHMTTKDFAEFLGDEMVDNILDGQVSRPKENTRKRSAVAEPDVPNAADKHVLTKIGTYESSGMPVQLHCVMCKAKTTTMCSGAGCRGVTICMTRKRTCYVDHCNGEGPGPSETSQGTRHSNKSHKAQK